MSESVCSCKIGQNIQKYGLPLDRELRQRHDNGESLRALARVHNERLLEEALADVNADVVGDVDAIYVKLTADDVSAGTRAEVRAQLSNGGVDVDGLLDDFVSHQTVRTHLRQCDDVDTSRSADLDVDRAKSIAAWASSRSEAVIERTLDRLQDAGEIESSPISITQSVRITCDDCGETYRMWEFLENRGCDCSTQNRDGSPERSDLEDDE